MSTSVIGLVVAIIGLITLILKWAYNPKRILEAKIDALDEKWQSLQSQINAPLAKHDIDTLTRLNAELLEVLRQRTEAKAKLEALGVKTVVKIMAGLFFVLTLSGCFYRTVYWQESDKVICDNAGKGICANTTYDCCVMGKGNYKSLVSLNPTVKEIKVQDNTKESDLNGMQGQKETDEKG